MKKLVTVPQESKKQPVDVKQFTWTATVQQRQPQKKIVPLSCGGK